jgi:hypothetical protein
MATTTTTATINPKPVKQVNDNGEAPSHREPLKLSGVLDQYKSFDVTPVIGKEFPDAQLIDWLNAPNSDDLIRDLAITGSSISQLLRVSSKLTYLQSPNAVSCSSVSKTPSTTTSRKSLPNALESSPANLRPPNSISTPSITQEEKEP